MERTHTKLILSSINNKLIYKLFLYSSDINMVKRKSIVSELFIFIKEHKAYWLAPIIVILLLTGALIILGSSQAAPFIYTLF